MNLRVHVWYGNPVGFRNWFWVLNIYIHNTMTKSWQLGWYQSNGREASTQRVRKGSYSQALHSYMWHFLQIYKLGEHGVLRVLKAFYHLHMWVGHIFGHVCLSVFLSVQAITFEPLDIETSFLVWRYILTISRSSLSIKVIGSRSYEKKW